MNYDWLYGLFFILLLLTQVAFIYMKLTKILYWSWYLIFIPTYIFILILFISIIIAAMIGYSPMDEIYRL